MNTFTLIFITALTISVSVRIWLALRHLRYVAAHRSAVPSAFADTISLTQHHKAADYTIIKTRLSLLQIALEAALLLTFTLGGGLQWLDDTLGGILASDMARNILLIGGVMLIGAAVELPLDLYRKFVIENRFGFNTMTPKRFLVDLLMQTTLGLLLGLPLLFAVLWLMHASGALWWLYAWLVWVGFNLTLLAIYPTFIAPLFNRFEPLPGGTLKSRIEQLLHKCGFTAQGLFVMDGSKRSSHGNAYFTGFGKTKRIVLFDTLLKHLEADEVEAVLAHELGHFKRRHVVKRMAWVFAASLVFLWVLNWLMTQTWFFSGLNVTSQDTGMALVLFFLVLPVFTFLLQPLSSLYSRKHEFEADQYAAVQTRAQSLVSALTKLYRDNASTLTPDPLYAMFYNSHPDAQQRIARLQTAVHN
ncbi:peptidase [Sulfuriferula plumbiphila]|uniref:Peptidase n=1 Tax=Sulfuriferula plumbiphila TaxID=171865 RepID=A0A512LBT9_9PROT|nr:M48 family metallopeptidase [Sulfuriferula plumbiphila]BBP04135.1 peptidase [Sulfuriferula plumbiphila]GEP31950.1 peptidase [Sulfuriferula plumbiphila]